MQCFSFDHLSIDIAHSNSRYQITYQQQQKQHEITQMKLHEQGMPTHIQPDQILVLTLIIR